jgi:hypothetical protein
MDDFLFIYFGELKLLTKNWNFLEGIFLGIPKTSLIFSHLYIYIYIFRTGTLSLRGRGTGSLELTVMSLSVLRELPSPPFVSVLNSFIFSSLGLRIWNWMEQNKIML